MSITVGAGKARVNCQFVHITAEQISPVAFQVIISFVVFPKIWFGQGRLFFLLCFCSLCRKKHPLTWTTSAFLAVCRESVIPAKAGIQKCKLDAGSSPA
jgi:hypothetical protein